MPRTAQDLRVAVVILTWNGREDTLACLGTVMACDWPDLDVILADNGSSDGTEAQVRERFPGVHVVQNGGNLGFAEGNNRGLQAAIEREADAILVLNNDTLVPPGLVRDLVAALEPGVAAVSPVIRHGDGRTIWFAGSHYDPARRHAGRRSSWECGRAALPDVAVPIERAVGAAMLVSRRAIEQVGMFDPSLFYLFEDVDWSLRMRRAGMRVLLEPRASITHHVASSQGGDPHTPTTIYYGTRNDLELRRRYGSARWDHQLWCVLAHAAVGVRGSKQRIRCAAAAIAGWRDYRRRRLGRWSRTPS